jgi:hypothetical protein
MSDTDELTLLDGTAVSKRGLLVKAERSPAAAITPMASGQEMSRCPSAALASDRIPGHAVARHAAERPRSPTQVGGDAPVDDDALLLEPAPANFWGEASEFASSSEAWSDSE